MTYERLLQEACEANLNVKETDLIGNKGRIKGNRIAIKKDIPTLKEKSCILAEELGHFYTSYGNILDQSKSNNRKQEYKARLWSFDKQVGLIGIIKAYESNCTSLFEVAEFLNITEEFLLAAISCYKNKYGMCKKLDNYTIYFEPCLDVFKLV